MKQNGVYYIREAEIPAANEMARKMLLKHGYWTALYNCMTLAIYCRTKDNRWSDEELDAVGFWWEVRNIIYRSR